MSSAEYIEELRDEIECINFQIRAAKREYNGYVKTAAWSAEICDRVDEINRFLEEATQKLDELHQEVMMSSAN
jgi:uncharacterized protein YaaN involved in tellurite resistance